MDRELIRRKALLAASSVVLAAGLAACPMPKEDTADSVAALDDTSVADTDTDTDTTGDGRPECTDIDTGAMATCCEDLRAWCETTYGVDTQAAYDCTYGPNLDGSTGCIPWGPPVPPRMRAVA